MYAVKQKHISLNKIASSILKSTIYTYHEKKRYSQATNHGLTRILIRNNFISLWILLRQTTIFKDRSQSVKIRKAQL